MKNIIYILLTLPTLLWGQKTKDRFNVAEKQYISQSDSFLIKALSRQTVDKYFKANSIYHYIQNDNKLTFPNDITNPQVTHIITSYALTIPELNIETTADLVFNKKTNCYYFKDSTEIPSYILKKGDRDLLDTGEIKKILVQNGVAYDNIDLGQCYYDDSLKIYAYSANETVVPFDRETFKETVNRYKLNASSGRIYNIDKNVVINLKPRGNWFYYIDNVKQYPKGTRLDSIFSLDSVEKVSIIIHDTTYVLKKQERNKLINILKLSTKGSGLQVKPTSRNIKFTFKGQDTPNRSRLYFSKGYIHFDTGIDRWGNTFDGTFLLPDYFDIENFIKTERH